MVYSDIIGQNLKIGAWCGEMIEEESDEQLMKRVQQGDQVAFGYVVKRYLPQSLGYVSRLMNRGDADDVVQEAFFKLWQQAQRWDEKKSSLKTWFYAILTNTCYTAIQKKKRSYGDTMPFCESGFNELEQNIIHEQMGDQLQQAMQRLKANERRAMHLTYCEAHSVKEVAILMKVTVKAVESLLVRSKKRLKRYCGGEA